MKPPRPGQYKPLVKCTAQQMEERVEFVADRLANQWRTGQIKKAVKLKFDIEFRQCAEYITRAKKLLQKQSLMTKEDARNIGINVLLGVIRNGNSHEKISAERSLREIFGYSAPIKLQPVGEEGIGPAQFILHVSEKELPLPK